MSYEGATPRVSLTMEPESRGLLWHGGSSSDVDDEKPAADIASPACWEA